MSRCQMLRRELLLTSTTTFSWAALARRPWNEAKLTAHNASAGAVFNQVSCTIVRCKTCFIT